MLGAVRQIDRRQAGGAPQALAALKHHLTGNLVEAHSIAAPAHRPWLLAVGGSDPLLRVFDRRVGYAAGPIKARPSPWASRTGCATARHGRQGVQGTPRPRLAATGGQLQRQLPQGSVEVWPS